MGATSIEWTRGADGTQGHTINPLRARLRSDPSKVGHYCEKVSPGCTFCYSSRFQPRRHLPEFSGTHGRGLDLVEPFLDVSKLEEVLRRRKPTTYFWCDMTDMFGRWVSDEWIAACFGVMAATPWHTHQVLTKRAERLPEWLAWLASRDGTNGVCPPSRAAVGFLVRTGVGPDAAIENALRSSVTWPLPNVWLGVSVEDQQRAEERIPHLLRAPAAVRFLSCEPLLGPVDLKTIVWGPGRLISGALRDEAEVDDWRYWAKRDGGIDWVICGGESGPSARPMHPQWARSLRDQCVAAGVPFFFKQWGAYQNGSAQGGRREIVLSDGRHAKTAEALGFQTERDRDGRCWHDLHPTAMAMVGKKRAGRLLDGREWNEMPEVRP